MKINFDDIKETIDINREELESDTTSDSVNDYIVEDLMSEMGYNRKKNKAVKKVSEGSVMWEIEGSNLAFAVGNFKSDLSNVVNNASDYCNMHNIDILMAITGDKYAICKNVEGELVEVASADIESEQSDDFENAFTAITKDEFNVDTINEMVPEVNNGMSITELEDVLQDNKDLIIEKINNTIDESVKEYIDDASNDELVNAGVEKVKSFFGTGDGSGEVVQFASESEEVNKLRELLDEKEGTIIDKNREIIALKEDIANIKETSGKTDVDIVNNYVKQIQELTNQLANSKDAVEKLSSENKELKQKIEDIEGMDIERAKELINVIEDTPDLPRNYVAVINKELMQYESLTQFVGKAMSKLYEIKQLEASQFLFDGDLFPLTPDSENRDVVFGGRSYKLSLDGLSEVEVLNKLRILFSHFTDIVFECKYIGSLQNSNDVNENIDSESTDDVEVETTEEEVESEGIEIESEGIEIDTTVAEPETTQFDGMNAQINHAENLIKNPPVDKNKMLIVSQLATVDELIYSEEKANYKCIKYIGNNDITFDINKDEVDMPLAEAIHKCLIAVLSMAVTNGDHQAINKFKQLDLSLIDNKIKLYTPETQGLTKIAATNYVIDNINDIKKATTLLCNILNKLNLMTEDLFIYYVVDTESDIVKEYAFDEKAVQLRIDPMYTHSDDDDEIEKKVAVLKGDMSNSITVTVKALKAHKDCLLDPRAVKTQYMTKKINKYADIVEAVENMIVEGIKYGADINTARFGRLPGTKLPIISDDPSAVGENYATLHIQENEYYMPQLEQWMVSWVLIKVHTTVFNNSAIAVQLEVNNTAIEYYNNEYNSSDPAVSLAIKTFAAYTSSCVK